MLGTAANADEAVRLTRNAKPDVLLLDLAMQGRTGLDVLRDLSDQLETTRVVLLTAAITTRKRLKRSSWARAA